MNHGTPQSGHATSCSDMLNLCSMHGSSVANCVFFIHSSTVPLSVLNNGTNKCSPPPLPNHCSNWDDWRSLRSKANKQIVPRKILEFTPQIYDVSGDAMDCFRANRGLDNTVNDVLTHLTDWSFEGDR